MSFFPHVVVGAVAGSFVPNPVGAALVGVMSHFVLDYIPHWDPVIYGVIPKGDLKRVILSLLLLADIFLSLVVLFLVATHPNMLWGAIAGGAVDIDNFLQYQNKFFPQSFPLLHKLFRISAHQPGSRWHKMTNVWLGLFNQGWVTLLGLVVLYLKLAH